MFFGFRWTIMIAMMHWKAQPYTNTKSSRACFIFPPPMGKPLFFIPLKKTMLKIRLERKK